MTDHLTENARLRAALEHWLSYGCPDCGGDCGSANPPVSCCIMQETAAALATPAPDAVSDMGIPMSVPEAARALMDNLFTQDGSYGPATRMDAIEACEKAGIKSQQLRAALRAIAESEASHG